MAWYSSERSSLEDSPPIRPEKDISLSSLERAVISNWIDTDLFDYQACKLEPTVWREELLRKLWRKLHNRRDWGRDNEQPT